LFQSLLRFSEDHLLFNSRDISQDNHLSKPMEDKNLRICFL
jgi:hypothetical protein